MHGCDIDARHVEWVRRHLDFVRALDTRPNEAVDLPRPHVRAPDRDLGVHAPRRADAGPAAIGDGAHREARGNASSHDARRACDTACDRRARHLQHARRRLRRVREGEAPVRPPASSRSSSSAATSRARSSAMASPSRPRAMSAIIGAATSTSRPSPAAPSTASRTSWFSRTGRRSTGARAPSIRCEAVEVARAARGSQQVHAASARGVRRVPRQCRGARVEPRAIVVPDDRSPFRALRPVAAGLVFARREGGAVGLRPP